MAHNFACARDYHLLEFLDHLFVSWMIPITVILDYSVLPLTFIRWLTWRICSFLFAVFVALSTFGAVNGILLTSSRLFYAGACQGQMPEILTMIQIQRFTPTPAVLAMALLSMLYLTVSDIFALINYVGFATWVSIELSTKPPRKLMIKLFLLFADFF